MNTQLIPKHLTKLTMLILLFLVPVFSPAQDTSTGDDIYELAPVTVVGSRIRGIDLETTLPVHSYSLQDLELTGYTRIDDTLRDMPLVTGWQFNGVDDGVNFYHGTRAVNMRGLGAAGNLVLVNGLRMPFYDSGGAVYPYYNISAIPMGALSGAQILTDGASAVYGSDAVSGVIDFKTLQEYDGTKVEINLGTYEGTQSDEASIILVHGQKVGNKGNLVVTLNHYEQNNLPWAEYEPLTDTNFLDRGGLNRSSGAAFPALLYAFGESDPYYDNIFTFALPTSNPTLDSMIVQQWPLNVNDGGYNWKEVMDLRGDNKESGIYLHYDHKLNSRIKAFLELYQQKSYARTRSAATPYFNQFQWPLPADNPYNPFGNKRTDGQPPNEIWFLQGRFVDAGPRVKETNINVPRIVVGLEGSFLSSWDWKVASALSESQSEHNGYNYFHWDRFHEVINGYDLNNDGQITNSEYFNPFGGNDAIIYDHMRVPRINTGEYELWMADAHATGPLWERDGLSLRAAVGTEFRREEMYYDAGEADESGLVIASEGENSDVSGTRDVAAVYSELQLKYKEVLTILGAGRFENYSESGNVETPKVSFSLNILPELMIRGSYGEGFVAPTLPAMYKPDFTIWRWGGNLWDPKREEWMAYSYQLNTGGNPNLQPETSTNYSGGIVVEPFTRIKGGNPVGDALKNITFGGDFFRIDYVNLWDFPNPQYLLDNEDDLDEIYPGQDIRVERADPLPNDPFSVGRVSQINQLFANVSFMNYRGYDVWFECPVNLNSWGMLNLRWDGNWLDSYKYAGDETAGIAPWGAPEYRWVATIQWKRNNWSTSLYLREVAGFPPAESNPDLPTAESSFRINAQVSYSGWEHTRVTVGARNLLNEDPSFHGFGETGIHGQHPTEKRFWYIRLERKL